MKCRECGFVYPDGLESCPNCASPSAAGARICSVCGSTMPANASFCKICGSDGEQRPAGGISFEGSPLCSNCGTVLHENADTCPECGSPVRKTRPVVGGKPFGIRTKIARVPLFFKILGVIAIILSLAVTAVSVFGVVKGGKSAASALALSRKDSLVGAYDGSTGEFVFADSRGVSFSVDCPDLTSFFYTPDRSVWVLVTGGTDGKASIFRVTRSGEEVVTTNAWPENIALSDSGYGIAYLSDVSDGVGCLRLWNSGDDKAKRLANDALSDSLPVISPDGKTVAWVGGLDNGNFSAYICSDSGTAKKLGNGIKPFAVSNSGDLVYYIQDGRVFVRSGSGDTELADNVGYSSLSEYHMTSDMRQVIYNRRGVVYISTDGQEGHEITDAWLYGLVVPGSDSAFKRENGVRLYIYPMNTFRGGVLELDCGLYYYGGNAGILRIAEAWDHVFLSQSGLSIIWENDGLVYRISDLRRSDKFSPAPFYYVEKTVSITTDSRHVYINNGSEIISVRRSGAHAVIAQSPDAVLLGVVDGRLYYTRDATLFSAKRGTKTKQMTDGRVLWAYQASGGLLVRTDAGSIFFTYEGKQIDLY